MLGAARVDVSCYKRRLARYKCGEREQTADHVVNESRDFRQPSGIQSFINLDQPKRGWLDSVQKEGEEQEEYEDEDEGIEEGE